MNYQSWHVIADYLKKNNDDFDKFCKEKGVKPMPQLDYQMWIMRMEDMNTYITDYLFERYQQSSKEVGYLAAMLVKFCHAAHGSFCDSRCPIYNQCNPRQDGIPEAKHWRKIAKQNA